MTFDEIDPLMRELLALHSLFRSLGFPADDLFVHYDEDQKVGVFVKQGDRQFIVPIERTELDYDRFSERWKEAAIAWAETLTLDQANQIIAESRARDHAIEIMAQLIFQGFSPAPGESTMFDPPDSEESEDPDPNRYIPPERLN